jgi:hypothetical protein
MYARLLVSVFVGLSPEQPPARRSVIAATAMHGTEAALSDSGCAPARILNRDRVIRRATSDRLLPILLERPSKVIAYAFKAGLCCCGGGELGFFDLCHPRIVRSSRRSVIV